MARLARVVVPAYPHHVIQRGNRRQQTFFCEQDYLEYIDLMSHWCSSENVGILAYCLMPNHVHLVCVPQAQDSLKKAIGEAHRRYTRLVNFREGWRGHLWQGRFSSFPMDNAYLLMAARYIELNPVRANLVKEPREYRFSSATAHIRGQNDNLVDVKPLLDMVDDWQDFLLEPFDSDKIDQLTKHARTGRPLGNNDFIAELEQASGRVLRPQKPGPKRKEQDN